MWCAFTSGLVSIFGIVFLVAFFTTFIGSLGTMNDIFVIVQYVLMLPLAVYLHLTLGHRRPTFARNALVIGLASMISVAVLQFLLVSGIMPFEVQIGLVSAAFLVALVWFIMIRKLGESTDVVPRSLVLTVLAGLYFGYPFWAFSVGRRLHALEQTSGG